MARQKDCFTWAWLCQSFMAVLLPHGAFPEEDRLTLTPGTAEPSGVSPPEAVDSYLIEHRLFCLITKNWRGRPLTSYEVIVNLIASTTTKTGLTVRAALDTNEYETGIKISDEQLAEVNLTPAKFHRDWNYTIRPKK